MYKVTYEFKCMICGATCPVSYETEETQIPIPKIPVGWGKLSDGYVCDQHVIIISDVEFTPDEV